MPASTSIEALEDRLGYTFRDRTLLERALTHRSWANEHPPAKDNEALAFLGDAVLGVVAAELLFRGSTDDGVGPLTQRRAELVSGGNLARWARQLELGQALRLGRGEERGGGRLKDSILATVFEAVGGALFLDGGLEAVLPLVRRMMAHRTEAEGGVPVSISGASSRSSS